MSITEDSFPPAWGKPTKAMVFTKSRTPLPGGYGYGCGDLGAWIASKLADPNLRAYPPSWGEPPMMQTRDLRPLGFGYGSGSGTIAGWISTNAVAAGGDEYPAEYAAENPNSMQQEFK